MTTTTDSQAPAASAPTATRRAARAPETYSPPALATLPVRIGGGRMPSGIGQS